MSSRSTLQVGSGRSISIWLFLTGLPVVAALISWQGYRDYQQFNTHQQELAKHLAMSISEEVTRYLGGLNRQLQFFAGQEIVLLNELGTYPQDKQLLQTIKTRLKGYLPQASAYALTDMSGRIITQDLNGISPQEVSIAIEAYAQQQTSPPFELINNNRSLPLLTSWWDRTGTQRILFVSVATSEIVTDLTAQGLPGHYFAISARSANKNESPRLEILPNNPAKTVLKSTPPIIEIEIPIANTLWNLVALRNGDFFAREYSKHLQNTVLLALGIIILSLPVFWFFRRQEKQQQRTQNLLQRSEARFRNFFEKASDALIIVDPSESRIVDANQQASNMLGFSYAKLLTANWLALHASKPELVSRLVDQILIEGSGWSDNLRYHTKSGHVIQAEISASRVKQEGKPLLLWRMRNVDERKRGEQALQALAASTASSTDEAFLKNCVRELATSYNCRYAFIGLFADDDKQHIETLTFWSGDDFENNFVYPLENTPCQDILNCEITLIRKNAAKQYPDDIVLKEKNIHAYLGAPLKDGDQKTIGLVSVMSEHPLLIEDSTKSIIEIYANRIALEIDRNRASHALIQSEQNYRDLIEGSIQAIIIHRDWKPLYVNPACVDIFRYESSTELLALEDLSQLFPEHEHARLTRYWRARVLGEDLPSNYELEAICKDHTPIVLQNLSRKILWRDQPAIQTILIDITERKVAQQALELSETRFRQFASASADWFWETNAKLEFTHFFGRFTATTGLQDRDVIGTSANKLLAKYVPDPATLKKYTEINKHKMHFKDLRTDWARPDNEVRILVNSGGPYYDSDGVFKGLRGAVHDVTEAIRAQDELNKYQSSLEQLVAERTAELEATQKELLQKERLATIGRLVATVSHELRNPLGAVRNAAYYLRRKVPHAEPRWRDYLEIIDKEVNAADKIISDLLETTRAKLPVVQEIDLAPLIRQIFRSYDTAVKGINLVYSSDPLDLFVSADRDHLRQVILNLVTNAMQASPTDNEVAVWAQQNQTESIIRVRDYGPGINPENREHIFEPLFTTKTKGNGLGLWISREIIERHGGTLELEDNTHPGASFKILLPRRQQEIDTPMNVFRLHEQQ